jgi:hypothetical protein
MNEQVPPMEVPAPPPSAPTGGGGKKGFAIASLVLGILSLCAAITWFCGGPISIAGIILGILGLKSSSRKMAIAGIVLSVIGFILMIIGVIVSLVLGSGSFLQQIQNQILSNSGY